MLNIDGKLIGHITVEYVAWGVKALQFAFYPQTVQYCGPKKTKNKQTKKQKEDTMTLNINFILPTSLEGKFAESFLIVKLGYY